MFIPKYFILAILTICLACGKARGEVDFSLLLKGDRVTVITEQDSITRVIVGDIVGIGEYAITVVDGEAREIGIAKKYIKEIIRHILAAPVKAKKVLTKKSAFLAGFMSFLIPGTGSFYAGDIGAG